MWDGGLWNQRCNSDSLLLKINKFPSSSMCRPLAVWLFWVLVLFCPKIQLCLEAPTI